jgi:hypothetical protein
MDFTHDLVQLMSHYHPRGKFFNPQGRSLKLSNHLATQGPLREGIESTFLTTSELFVSSLNCSMSDGSTYCSAFSEDTVFGAILESFKFRWTGSCIAN